MRDTADVIVIGGGTTGTAIAWQLGRRGIRRTLLLDRNQHGGAGTARSCAIVRTHYTHPELAKLALHCLHVFENFEETVGGPADFKKVGWAALLGQEDREHVAANVEMQKTEGIAAEFLPADRLKELFPAMHVDDVGGAAWEPDSGYADPQLTNRSFAEAAVRLGVDVRFGCAVAEIRHDGSSEYEVVTANGERWRTGTLIIAAGAETAALVRPLGVELPIAPIWHTVGVVEFDAGVDELQPTISDRVLGNYYRAVDGHHALVGATAPLDGVQDWDFSIEHDARPDALSRGIEHFAQRFPSWKPMRLIRSYTGIYDCTPDVQPVIGAVDGHDGLLVAAGFSGHGFKLAPGVGAMVADLVTSGETDLARVDMFDPGRFADARPIVSDHAYTVPTLG